MNDEVKDRITELRQAGVSYMNISRLLDINENTVKTFCRRNGLTGTAANINVSVLPGLIRNNCKTCGKPFLQYPGHREKVFCCDACRIKWWNTHLSSANRKSMYEYTCPTCRKKFRAYEYRHRKYCSHECFIAARFGSFPCE